MKLVCLYKSFGWLYCLLQWTICSCLLKSFINPQSYGYICIYIYIYIYNRDNIGHVIYCRITKCLNWQVPDCHECVLDIEAEFCDTSEFVTSVSRWTSEADSTSSSNENEARDLLKYKLLGHRTLGNPWILSPRPFVSQRHYWAFNTSIHVITNGIQYYWSIWIHIAICLPYLTLILNTTS